MLELIWQKLSLVLLAVFVAALGDTLTCLYLPLKHASPVFE